MNRLVKIIQPNYYILIVLFALVWRIWGLGLNPVGITHDEVHDLINAKSLALTGQGTPGTVAGIFTGHGYCNGNCVFGELGSFLMVPWMKFFPLNIWLSKIPFLIAGLGMVYFGGKVFENLGNDRRIGLATSLVMAINPWAIHFGRTAYENLYAFCFYLWALYLFTLRKPKKIHLWLAFGLSFLASLSYFGAKPLLPFIVIIGAFYFGQTLKNSWKMIVVGLVVAMGLFGGYALLLKNSEAGVRLKELNNSNQVIATTVNDERRQSLGSPLIKSLMSNKMLIIGKFMGTKYLGAFNPVYLFVQGEQAMDTFIIPGQAYLYLIDGVFIVLGLAAMSRFRKASFFIISLLLVAPISSATNATFQTYALRSGMMFPLWCGLAGWGIVYVIEELKTIKLRCFFLIATMAVYLLSVSYFELEYWNRLPYAKSEGWNFSERVLVNYISRVRQQNPTLPIVLRVKDNLDIAYLYAFYSGKYNDESFIQRFNLAAKQKSITVDGITFTSQPAGATESNTLLITDPQIAKRNDTSQTVRITEPRDNGDKFIVAEDKLCLGQILPRYSNPRSITDFEVEKMGTKDFCEKWVVKF